MAEGFFEDGVRERIHKLEMHEIFGDLDTSHDGLDANQIANRLARFGKNAITEKKRSPFIVRFGKQLTNQFAILLWVGAILSFFGEYFQPGEGMLYIGIALVAVVFLNAIFTYWQESKVEHAMSAFKNMLSRKARVIREGREQEIPTEQLVPGDILILAEGDKIPADARIYEVNGLKVNNASLTGESEPQLRSIEATSEKYLESRNIIFSGTLVSAGSGRAVVFATGDHTELGRIAQVTLDTKSVDSPMQKELKHFIDVISKIAMGLGVVFFIIGWLIGNPFWGNLIFAIGIIVANVPEGLLPTVTLALSIASQRMAKKNALIKTLESVETLGSTTVICTDKTGTLTVNNMHVTNLFLDGMDFSTTAVESLQDYEREWKNKLGESPHEKSLSRAVFVSALCNNASMHRPNKGADPELIGDPTETALLLFADQTKVGPNTDWMRQEWRRTLEIPFDSETKEMITVHEREGERTAYLKGAPEAVLAHCDKTLINGAIKTLTKAQKEQYHEQNKHYANKGKRVLALAYKHVPPAASRHYEIKKQDYIFIGFAAMYDPPRAEVHKAVEKCRAAGIKIIVISGDHPLTVAAIAREVGIITKPDPLLLTGDDLAQMSHTQLIETLKHDEIVLARTSPQDKMRVVSALQDMDHVVAVTGDGVNDAPALKKADIGIAMGIAGTDVAKEAADMVLMDDNFSTIVHAVEEGRVIYSNIRKFIAYILTSNIPEILPFIAFVLLNIPLPLTVVLILAIDLGTDLLPALGLATEPAEYDVMKQAPRDRSERLLSGKLLFMAYGIIGMIQAAAGFAAYFFVLYQGGWSWGQELAFSDPLYQQAISAFFISIIVAQVADVLICRTRKESIFSKGLFSNKLVLVGIGAELLLGWIITSTQIGNTVFNTHPLPAIVWLIPVPFALWIFVGDEVRKWLRRRGNTFVERWLSW